MELRHLRYFAAAARELNLTRAANVLHISQPAISRLIRELECELGTPLFIRVRFGLKLTGAGETFLVYTQRILNDCEAAKMAVKEVTSERTELKVGFISTALGSFLGNAITRLSEDHPEVDVTVFEMSPGEQIAALRSGIIDVAFAGNQCTSLESEFSTRILHEIPLQAVLPHRHKSAKKDTLSLTELADDNFVGYDEDKFPGRNQTIFDACAVAGYHPNIAFKANSLNEVLGIISAGKGVCLMPSDVSNLPHPNVVFVDLLDTVEPIRITAAWLPHNSNTAISHLLDYLTFNLPDP